MCIAIPTYNEKENLSFLIPRIQTTLQSSKIDASILIVDDNSPDGTGKLAEELSRMNANIHIISRPKKLGLGSAYRTAFKYFLDRSSSHAIIQMDADNSHDPKYVPNFLSKIDEGYDVVIGCRYIRGGGIIGWNPMRKLISNGANSLARLFTGIGIHDATSGYRAYSRKAVRKIGITNTLAFGFNFQIEILFEARKAQLKIAEVPFTFINRKAGKSKMSPNEITSFAGTCLGLSFKRIKSLLQTNRR